MVGLSSHLLGEDGEEELQGAESDEGGSLGRRSHDGIKKRRQRYPAPYKKQSHSRENNITSET